jgi:hypothetical protein
MNTALCMLTLVHEGLQCRTKKNMCHFINFDAAYYIISISNSSHCIYYLCCVWLLLAMMNEQTQGSTLLDRVASLKKHGIHPDRLKAAARAKLVPKGHRKKHKYADRYKDAA